MMPSLTLRKIASKFRRHCLADGFDDVVEGTDAQGFGGSVNAGSAGDHDHRHVGKNLLGLFQQVDAASAGQDNVGENQVDVFFPQQCDPLVTVGGTGDRVAFIG
jgi:hypothetical protein